MAIFGKRRGRTEAAPADGAPRTLLDEPSPYGSRRILVATNGTETWAQLFDATGRQVTALWLAAHRGPSPDVQLSVPPEATRNPSGRPPFGHVEAVWFEEGDGVALFDNEGMLAVLPGWAGPETLPGYSREAVVQTPSAAPLQNAVDQFAPRAERARGYWTWRSRPEAWQEYQNDVQHHIGSRLGPPQQVWPLGEGNPPVLAQRHGTEAEHVAVTVGMSGQRMPAVEQYVQDPSEHARIELAVAGLGAGDADLLLLRWLARHPWRAATWIGHTHTVRWPGQGFPAGAPFSGVLLVADPTLLPGPPAPDLSGNTIFGDPVHFLWLVPVTDDDLAAARAEGPEALLARLRATGRTWVAGEAGAPTPASDTTAAGDDLLVENPAATGADDGDEITVENRTAEETDETDDDLLVENPAASEADDGGDEDTATDTTAVGAPAADVYDSDGTGTLTGSAPDSATTTADTSTRAEDEDATEEPGTKRHEE